MAIIKQRLHRKNASGQYDTVHLETSASLVKMNSGATAEDAINSKAASDHTHTQYASSTHNHDTVYSKTNHGHTGYAASSHTHNASDINAGTLGVARGGTGRTSVTAGSFLRGNGTGAMTETTLEALKKELGIVSSNPVSGGNGSTSGTTTSGGTMTFDNMTWIVVDDGTYNSGERVLMLRDVWCLMQGYNIERNCTYFWNYVLSAEARAKCTPHHFKEFGANAYTIPVFVPTSIEVAKGAGGFNYLDGDARRKANMWGTTTATAWWTSSHTDGNKAYIVTTIGTLIDSYTNSGPGYTAGFRPFVSLKR